MPQFFSRRPVIIQDITDAPLRGAQMRDLKSREHLRNAMALGRGLTAVGQGFHGTPEARREFGAGVAALGQNVAQQRRFEDIKADRELERQRRDEAFDLKTGLELGVDPDLITKMRMGEEGAFENVLEATRNVTEEEAARALEAFEKESAAKSRAKAHDIISTQRAQFEALRQLRMTMGGESLEEATQNTLEAMTARRPSGDEPNLKDLSTKYKTKDIPTVMRAMREFRETGDIDRLEDVLGGIQSIPGARLEMDQKQAEQAAKASAASLDFRVDVQESREKYQASRLALSERAQTLAEQVATAKATGARDAAAANALNKSLSEQIKLTRDLARSGDQRISDIDRQILKIQEQQASPFISDGMKQALAGDIQTLRTERLELTAEKSSLEEERRRLIEDLKGVGVVQEQGAVAETAGPTEESAAGAVDELDDVLGK